MVAVEVKMPVLSSNAAQTQNLQHGLPGFQFQPVKSPIISITRHYQGVTAEYLCTEWLVPLPVVPGLDTGEDNVGVW